MSDELKCLSTKQPFILFRSPQKIKKSRRYCSLEMVLFQKKRTRLCGLVIFIYWAIWAAVNPI